MNRLRREPVEPHPWRRHRWRIVDGLIGVTTIEQCSRCNLVRITDLIDNRRRTGPHTILTTGGPQ